MKVVNKATGKESTRTTDFNQANWGTITSGYILSIQKNLSNDIKFDGVIADVQKFAKANTQCGDSATALPSSAPEQEFDEHTQLCDDESNDDSE